MSGGGGENGASRGADRLGARAASPAKRSADDMEDASRKQQTAQQPEPAAAPGSFTIIEDGGPTDFDILMSGMTPAPTNSNGSDSTASATEPSFSTSATSLELQHSLLPPDGTPELQLPAAHKEPYSTERIDMQYTRVSAQMEKPISEGDRGVVLSQKWLNRVMSRTTEGLKSGAFPKDSREGIVGPVDNSDIIADGALDGPWLNDPEHQPFIPLKPGLAFNEDYRVVPHEAYDFIMGEYGYKSKHPIVRYAHDTTQGESVQQNVQYEVYPPTITIRKVSSNMPQQPVKTKNSIDALRLKKERETRGQKHEDDAVRLVSSRSERFQSFLSRSKEAAAIPRSAKVKVWRHIEHTNVIVDRPTNGRPGVLSPPASRDSSPANRPNDIKLLLDNAAFDQMRVGIDLEHVDAKDETNNDKYNGRSTMETVALTTDQTIILEERLDGPGGGEFQSDSKKSLMSLNRKSNKPTSAPASGRTSPAPAGITTRGRARRDGRTCGTVGLTNLGNTCYMNSALQCIRSVEELAVFFVSNAYKKEINNDNPLGHHGAMANAYANVLRGIYSKQAAGAFTPSEFKKRLGNLQPLFSGYGQQDSQEFLSFLVDALHEDLNRIKKKPYNENPDSDDKTVHDPQAIIELGEIYRKNHRARNDSVAMDLFSGFYKNTMECPVCDKISITFDPYSLLTVQLPIENSFTHTITFFPLHGKPINHALDIDKNSTVKAVKESIAKKHPGVTADRLWMIEMYSHKVYKVFEDYLTLAETGIVPNDYIFMYELDSAPTNLGTPKKQTYYSMYSKPSSDNAIPPEGMESPKADCIAVPVFNRWKKLNGDYDTQMHPLYISLTRDEAKDYEIILKKVLIAVSNITSRAILTESNTPQHSSGQSSRVTELDSEPPVNEDTAGISDHSAPSEDGYVNVSLERPGVASASSTAGASPMQVDQQDGTIPAGFMEADYYIVPELRNQLFDMQVAQSLDNMHCASMQSFNDRSIRPMFDRVKLPARRSSLQSSGSDDSASASASEDHANGASDESDEDELDKPDIVLGESQLSDPLVRDSDEDELMPASSTRDIQAPRSGRRRNHRGKKDKRGKRGGRVTYGQSDRARYGQAPRVNGNSALVTRFAQEDGPYYVQIGEAIVLDWLPEAVSALFDGSADVDGDMRGHRLSSDTGRDIEFFHDPELLAKRKRREDRKRHGVDLEDCFVETGKREVLSEDNAWYCNRCKEMRRAAKTLEIWTIPDILVVHLKRFGGNRSFRDKIDVLVDYPINGLDMTDKVGLKEDGKEYIYDLFAVDNHYGGLGGGHYTAMAKNFYDGQWYDYNDSSCTKIGSDAKLQSAAAYLLFYRRRSDKPLGPAYLQDLVNEARNPGPTDSHVDEAEESESGEGRLGGPTISSLHGSSSASTGAGAAATSGSLVRELGAVGGRRAGAPAPAGSSPTTRPTRMTSSNDVDDEFGDFVIGQEGAPSPPPPPPPPPPHPSFYGSQDTPAWSFSALNQTAADSDGPSADDLLGTGPDADDAASTTAELDRDSAYGDSPGHTEYDNDFADSRERHLYSAGRVSPASDIGELPGSPDNIIHGPARLVEDATMSGLDDEDPPAVDIHVESDEHSKMD